MAAGVLGPICLLPLYWNNKLIFQITVLHLITITGVWRRPESISSAFIRFPWFFFLLIQSILLCTGFFLDRGGLMTFAKTQVSTILLYSSRSFFFNSIYILIDFYRMFCLYKGEKKKKKKETSTNARSLIYHTAILTGNILSQWHFSGIKVYVMYRTLRIRNTHSQQEIWGVYVRLAP